jgi:hypothetical protein
MSFTESSIGYPCHHLHAPRNQGTIAFLLGKTYKLSKNNCTLFI